MTNKYEITENTKPRERLSTKPLTMSMSKKAHESHCHVSHMNDM